MPQSTPTRRERLRVETAAEIKTTALRQMAAGGAAAVSLRAIARDMGMTAGAIYSYYDTRDALINTLISDVYTSLADTLEAAHSGVPAWDTARRVLAHGHAYRRWAIEHPEEFRLVYGDPVPGHDLAEAGAASDAALRVCRLLIQLVVAAWPKAGTVHGGEDFSWADFPPSLVAELNAERSGLPPAALALSLRIWGRMHGLVTLEIYGHLNTQITDAAKLYHQELLDLVASLGLDVPDGAAAGADR